ncbi:hypothetical protein D3C84_932910 [compost metagenome]
MQDFGKGRGHEDHVVAFPAIGHELAHDFFVGGVQGLVDRDTAGHFELVQRIGGHVAVPDGDDHILGTGG